MNSLLKITLAILCLVLPGTQLLGMFSLSQKETARARQKKYQEILQDIPTAVSNFDRLLHQLIWQLSRNNNGEGSSSAMQKITDDLNQLSLDVDIMQEGMREYVDDKNSSLNIEPIKVVFDDMQQMIKDICAHSNPLETYQKLIQLRAYSNTFFALLKGDLSEKDKKSLESVQFPGGFLPSSEERHKQHLADVSVWLERDFESLLLMRIAHKIQTVGTNVLWAGKGTIKAVKKAYELTKPESIKEKKKQVGKFLITQSDYLKQVTHRTRDEVTARSDMIKSSLQPLVTFLEEIQHKSETNQIEQLGDAVSNQIESKQKICSKTTDITKDVVKGISGIPVVSPSALARHVVLAPSLKGQIVLDLFAVVEASGLIKDLNKLHDKGIWICDHVWQIQNAIHGQIDEEAASAGRYKYPAKAVNDILRGEIGSAMDNVCNELAERGEDLDKIKQVCTEWLQYLDENVYHFIDNSYELFEYLGRYRDRLDQGIVLSEERIKGHIESINNTVDAYLDQIHDLGQELVAQGEMKQSVQRLHEYLTCLKDTYGTDKQVLESKVPKKEKRTFVEQQKMFYGDPYLQSLHPISSKKMINNRAHELAKTAHNTKKEFKERQRKNELRIDDLERKIFDLKGKRNILQLRLAELKNNKGWIDSIKNYLSGESITYLSTHELKKRKQLVAEKIAFLPEVECQYSDLAEQTGEKLRREKYELDIELINRKLKNLEGTLNEAFQEISPENKKDFDTRMTKFEKELEQCHAALERAKQPLPTKQISVLKDDKVYPIVWKKANGSKGKERTNDETIAKNQFLGVEKELFQRACFNKMSDKISCLAHKQESLRSQQTLAKNVKARLEKKLNPTDTFSWQNIFGYCFNRWRAWWYGSSFRENIALQEDTIKSYGTGLTEIAREIAEEQDKDDYKKLREKYKNKRKYVYTEGEKKYVIDLARKNPLFWYALHPKNQKRKKGIKEQWRTIIREEKGRCFPTKDYTSREERIGYDYYKAHRMFQPEGYTFVPLDNGELKALSSRGVTRGLKAAGIPVLAIEQ